MANGKWRTAGYIKSTLYVFMVHAKYCPSHGFFPRGLATQKRVWYRVCSCTNLRALVSFSFIHASLLNPFKISYRIPLHGFFPFFCFSFTRLVLDRFETAVPNSDARIPPGIASKFPYWIPTFRAEGRNGTANGERLVIYRIYPIYLRYTQIF
jgi:hypothetical protein